MMELEEVTMPAMSEATQTPVTAGSAAYIGTYELAEDGFWAAQVVEVP